MRCDHRDGSVALQAALLRACTSGPQSAIVAAWAPLLRGLYVRSPDRDCRGAIVAAWAPLLQNEQAMEGQREHRDSEKPGADRD